MTMITRAFTEIAVTVAIAIIGSASFAAAPATKDDAMAMVKKAVAYIKTEGPGQAYSAIDDHAGQFVDGDLYVVVYGLDGKVLAHGADASRVGTNQLNDKDAIRARAHRARRKKPELLAALQIHEPREQEGRA